MSQLLVPTNKKSKPSKQSYLRLLSSIKKHLQTSTYTRSHNKCNYLHIRWITSSLQYSNLHYKKIEILKKNSHLCNNYYLISHCLTAYKAGYIRDSSIIKCKFNIFSLGTYLREHEPLYRITK